MLSLLSEAAPRRRTFAGMAALGLLGGLAGSLSRAAEMPQNPYPVILTNVRAIDGTNSGLRNEYGATDSELLRRTPPDYPGDGSGEEIITSPERPNPRTISNTVSVQTTTAPNDRGASDFLWAWGQFLDHDIDLSFTDPAAGSADIAIEDPDDILGPNPIPFTRSEFVVNPIYGNREQINGITAYIDGSNVYGSTESRAAALREFSGGRLRMGPNDLLPFNTDGLDNAPSPEPHYFLAGDIRANENVVLTSLHTLFMREHNRLAHLIALHDPFATDEQVYQLARKIVGAELQIITYREFLPALLGPRAPPLTWGRSAPEVDPGINNEFSTAFYRMGHSMLSPNLELWQRCSRLTSLPLRNAFFNPTYLAERPHNMDRLLSGLQMQSAQEIDTQIVDDVRNFLFGPPGAGGMDLAALNIQRGRDHGLADYNTLRGAYGLPRVQSFAEVTDDPVLAANLEALYGSVDNIDPWVGALAEPHVAKTSVGPLMLAALQDQFGRLIKGDAFNALVDVDLNQPLVKAIVPLSTIRLADVIRANTNVAAVSGRAFFTGNPVNVDVTLTYDRRANRLILTGNRAANHIAITRVSSTMLMIAGLGGTRINGRMVVLQPTLWRPHVTIDLGAGNDSVQVYFCTLGHTCIALGDGQDSFNSLFTTARQCVSDEDTGDLVITNR